MVNFGTLQCKHNENLCDKLGREHGIIYYGTDGVEKGKGIVSLLKKFSFFLSLSLSLSSLKSSFKDFYPGDNDMFNLCKEITGADPQEIAFQVMSQLPDVQDLSKNVFEVSIRRAFLISAYYFHW